MNEEQSLPRGWVKVKLKNVTYSGSTRNPQTSNTDNFFYVDIEAIDNKSQRIVAAKLISKSHAPSRARMIIKKDDIIFSLVRPYLKNIAIVPEELEDQIASTAYCVLRPETDIFSSFIFYALVRDSFIASIKTYGSSPPAARDEEFWSMSIPIAPVTEQQRIVSAIEQQFTRIDAGVGDVKRIKKNLQRARVALIRDAVEGKLTKKWREAHLDTEAASVLLQRILAERRAKWEESVRAKGKDPQKERYPEPAAPNIKKLGGLPEKWCWATVEQLSNKVVDGTHHTPTYTKSGVPFISVKDIQNGHISFDDCKYISQEEHENLIQRCNPENGDVLITKSGTIGRVAIVKTSKSFSLFVSVALIKTCKFPFNQEYFKIALEYYIQNINIQQAIKGGLIKNLHLEDLRIVPLRLPPLDEQEQIVAEVEQQLSIINKYEAVADGLIKYAEWQRQAILQRAFAGQLVEQDENDEPASVLLERIRQERKRCEKRSGVHYVYAREDGEPLRVDVDEVVQSELWVEGEGRYVAER